MNTLLCLCVSNTAENPKKEYVGMGMRGHETLHAEPMDIKLIISIDSYLRA